jgi:hypothetical protein
MAKEIKIFMMNESDWYAAESVEDALKAMAEHNGYNATPESITALQVEFEVFHPVEMQDKELDLLIYEYEDENGEQVVRTFREQLAQMIDTKQKFPCFFASAEF